MSANAKVVTQNSNNTTLDEKAKKEIFDRLDKSTLGAGYNSFLKKTIPDTIFNLNISFEDTIPANRIRAFDTLITSHESSIKELDAAFKMKTNLNMDLGANITLNHEISDTEVYYVSHYRTDLWKLKVPNAAPLQYEQLKRRNDLNAFFAAYGDSYVSEISYGAYYIIYAHIKIHDVSKSAKIKLDLEGMDLFNLHANAVKLIKDKKITISLDHVGVGYNTKAKPQTKMTISEPKEIASWINEVQKFYTIPDKGSLQIIEFETNTYFHLSSAHPNLAAIAIIYEFLGYASTYASNIEMDKRIAFLLTDTLNKAKKKVWFDLSGKPFKDAKLTSDQDKCEYVTEDHIKAEKCFNGLKSISETLQSQGKSWNLIAGIIRNSRKALMEYRETLQVLIQKYSTVDKRFTKEHVSLRPRSAYFASGTRRGDLPNKISLQGINLGNARQIAVSAEDAPPRSEDRVTFGIKYGQLVEKKAEAESNNTPSLMYRDTTIALSNEMTITSDVLRASKREGLRILCGPVVNDIYDKLKIKLTVTILDNMSLSPEDNFIRLYSKIDDMREVINGDESFAPGDRKRHIEEDSMRAKPDNSKNDLSISVSNAPATNAPPIIFSALNSAQSLQDPKSNGFTEPKGSKATVILSQTSENNLNLEHDDNDRQKVEWH